jgi:rhodanese-related sulfurtransferase
MPVPLELSPQVVQSRFAAGERLVWIDVREPEEFAITRIEGAELLPMRSVPAGLERLQRLAEEGCVVLLCHQFTDSLLAAAARAGQLLQLGRGD